MGPAAGFLLEAIRHRSVYSVELPYNLNWMFKPSPTEADFLRANPLIILDVGCRGGAPAELAPFFPYMRYYAFDADQAECQRISQQPHPYHQFKVMPYYIGPDTGSIAFNLFHRPGDSSVYGPASRFKTHFAAPPFEISRTLDLSSQSLDRVSEQEALEPADLIKLDTQGSELEILQSSPKTLAGALMVEIELEFIEMYEGQPLAHHVMAFMADQGFDLVYLNRCFGQKQQVFKGDSRGQLIFGDGLFVRREDRLNGFSTERLARFALLLANYGHRDLAAHLLLFCPGVQDLLPGFHRHLKSRPSRWQRRFSRWADKLALLLLHARRSNRGLFESDRSWPIR